MAGASLASSAGGWPARLTRRLDRLSEGQFALVSFLPAAILIGLIVIPPILAVFGMSVFRIELAKDDNVPFVGVRNYQAPGGRHRLPRLGAANARLRRVHDPVVGPARTRRSAAAQPWLQGFEPSGNCRPAAVGDRPGRDRALLGVHLRQSHRHRERRADGDRADDGTHPVAPVNRYRCRRGGHRDRVAIGATPDGPDSCGAQDHPGGARASGSHGRRVVVPDLPVRDAAGDPEHPAGGVDPPGDRLAPGLRSAVPADRRRTRQRDDHDELLHLQHGRPERELRLLGCPCRLPAGGHRRVQRRPALPAAPQLGARRADDAPDGSASAPQLALAAAAWQSNVGVAGDTPESRGRLARARVPRHRGPGGALGGRRRPGVLAARPDRLDRSQQHRTRRGRDHGAAGA